jgi:alpha-glucosidase (family GH31 glycosyl hydrolase)
MLNFIVPFTLSSANVGCFFWSHDIGGHLGPRIEEAMARWVQFGALSASLRLHSERSATLDRRPWACEPMYAESMRRAFALRTALLPTIYTAARRCHDESVPLLRPMYIDHPDEERAYTHGRQYMLGDLLCAPVTRPGRGARKVGVQKVWFPESLAEAWGADGTERAAVSGWRNWLTGERYEPGSVHRVKADIDQVPLFAPEGMPVVLALRERDGARAAMGMAGEPARAVAIRCFPGAPGSAYETRVYDDDGESDGYLRGEFAWTRIRAEWGACDAQARQALRLCVYAPEGPFAERISARQFVLEIARGGSVASVTLPKAAQGGVFEVEVASEEAGGAGSALVRRRALDDAPS